MAGGGGGGGGSACFHGNRRRAPLCSEFVSVLVLSGVMAFGVGGGQSRPGSLNPMRFVVGRGLLTYNRVNSPVDHL